MPTAETALKGRPTPIPTPPSTTLFSRPLKGPYPAGLEKAMFGLGCFWGAERKFWSSAPASGSPRSAMPAASRPTRPTRKCAPGRTGHNEVVLVVFDPKEVSYEQLLKTFWESHDPTQGMRQGNDVGTQYRSGIYTFTEAQRDAAEASKAEYQKALTQNGLGQITTEILPAPEFYFAEDYHQQYLAKVPHGYCGLGGTGVACPTPTGVAAA